jgi:hypothetical protein
VSVGGRNKEQQNQKDKQFFHFYHLESNYKISLGIARPLDQNILTKFPNSREPDERSFITPLMKEEQEASQSKK